MTEAAPPDVKRRRLSGANTSHQNIRCIADLPSRILAHAASFLAAPSKALFAIALDENSAVTPNERSSAIVGNNWDTLDFGEIEKEVAAKLSDSDIENILLCIDAVNKLKRLKLAYCTNITGTCLEPLRGSLIIEQIDLSLAGDNQSPDLNPVPPISCEHVLPILDNIIAREGCALMHLQFPFVWRVVHAGSDFHAFIGRYNEMRTGRENTSCLKCNQILPGPGSNEWIKTDGTHWYTCYGCLKHYCHSCDCRDNIVDDVDDDVSYDSIFGLFFRMMNECALCRRNYCWGCSKMTECSGCNNKICKDCYEYKCAKCDDEICLNCVEKCECCDKFYCQDCFEGGSKEIDDYETDDIPHTCLQRDVKRCDVCRLQDFRQGQLHCTECIKQIAHLLLGESKQVRKENEHLKDENGELKSENRELKLENKELTSGKATLTKAAPPDVKRRRLSTADGDSQETRYLTDLPTGILAHAASFLAAPSRAFFAVALDENSATTSSPNERSLAIVGNNWDVLDFGQIEKDLAEELSDADIERVLHCIDAASKLKRLKLTSCTNITGTCLEPLRGSLIVEQIDLSLVGNERPDPDLEPPISCDHVLPILDSIIEREGCALMHLQFPSVWRKEPSTDSEFHAFIVRYNEMRRGRGEITCLKCNKILPHDEEEWIETYTEDDYDYGTHRYTCYGCFKHYCNVCFVSGQSFRMTNECVACGRNYCKGCVEMTEKCSGSNCKGKICNDCYKYKCVECDEEFCSKCVENDSHGIEKCDYCDDYYCEGCYRTGGTNEEIDPVPICPKCQMVCCNNCRLRHFRQGEGHYHCTECIKQIAPLLVDESVAQKALREENEQLKVENGELKRENRELQLSIMKSLYARR